MPAKPRKTDWKRMLQQEHPGTPSLNRQDNPPVVTAPPPEEILAAAARSSEGNSGMFPPIRNRDDLLAMLETNRKMQLALKTKKGKPYHPGLKGLFGGG